MVAFCVIVGDSIPHVLTAIFPKLPDMSVLWLFSDRRFIIVIFVLGISYPLSLYRDIAKVSGTAKPFLSLSFESPIPENETLGLVVCRLIAYS